MATIRERSGKSGKRAFNAQVRMQGYPPRSETFPTRRAAERWAKTVEAAMIESRHDRSAEARLHSVADAIDRYVANELPKKRDASPTWLNWWRAEIGAVKLANVMPALLAEKRDKLAHGTYRRAKPGTRRSKVQEGEAREYPRSPKTANKYLRRLSHVFTKCVKEWHWLSYNPVAAVSMLPEGEGRVRCLTDDERRALLTETAKDATLHAFVVVALSTAARAGELRKLEWADVDLKSGRLLFRETKNTRSRTSWVHGEALRLLVSHGKVRRLGGTRVFESAAVGLYEYGKPFRAAVAAARVENLKFHDLRHTAATMLARQGATEAELRAVGGWRSNVVAKYVHLSGEDSKAALEKLAEKIGQ